MILIIKWFLWRRWLFMKWTDASDGEHMLRNCKSCNIAGCRTHHVIYKDMEKILLSRHEENA